MSLLKVTSNVDSLSASVEVLAKEMASGTYAEGREAFKEVRDILMSGLKDNISTFSGVPLADATKEYKARKGLDPRPLVASGNTLAGIDGRHGGNFAKAMRGSAEWYIFLHDRGRGYSYWSVDGRRRANTTGARTARRERNRPGTTAFPERRVFLITAGMQQQSIDALERGIQKRLDRVGAK